MSIEPDNTPALITERVVNMAFAESRQARAELRKIRGAVVFLAWLAGVIVALSIVGGIIYAVHAAEVRDLQPAQVCESSGGTAHC